MGCTGTNVTTSSRSGKAALHTNFQTPKPYALAVIKRRTKLITAGWRRQIVLRGKPTLLISLVKLYSRAHSIYMQSCTTTTGVTTMTESQRIEMRRSKVRERLAAIAKLSGDTYTAEIRTEESGLQDEYGTLELRHRSALISEDAELATRRAEASAPDAEMRARVELRSRARLSNYFLAAARGRMVDGAEAELQAAANVHNIPIELFDVPGPAETRAVTPAPGTVGVNLDPIRPAVFANSIAARLGIDMPRVPSGTYATGTITTSATAEAKQKSPHADAAIAATAGAITVQTAGVKRISARLELTIEDIASVGTENFESILRQNLSLVLADELDNAMLVGNGAAPNISGIFQELDNPTAPGATVANYDNFIAAFAGGVDGLWANMAKEVSIVVNPETYRLSLKTFRDGSGGNANRGEIAFADYAMTHFGGWWTNKRMPSKTAHIAQAILYRGGRSAMGASAGMRTAVCPHWGEVSIDDIYTGAASGVRSFTMHMLLGDVILVQEDAYEQISFRVSV